MCTIPELFIDSRPTSIRLPRAMVPECIGFKIETAFYEGPQIKGVGTYASSNDAMLLTLQYVEVRPFKNLGEITYYYVARRVLTGRQL